jgi:ribosomal protein S18 acetylase RimI-like enzyme
MLADIIKILEIPDLSQVAEIHRKAFPDSFLTALGSGVVRRYYEWQLVGPHETTALGVFKRDTLEGFCFGGIFRGAINGFLRTNRYYLIGKILTHPSVILNSEFRQRMLVGWRLKIFRKANIHPSIGPSPNTRHFGILSIGVDPKLQRQGIGKLLMEAAEEAARKKGHREMRLTVNVNNLSAINFYKKLGWKKCLLEDGSFQGAMKKSLVADPNG